MAAGMSVPEGWSLPKPAAELRADYERDGYVVIPNLLSTEECDDLQEEMIQICRGNRGVIPGLRDDITDATSDEEVLKQFLAIHFPHKLDSDKIKNLVREPKTLEALRAVMPTENIKLLQTMMFVKAPGKPGQAPHQDENYIPTRDRSLTATWIALEDVSIANGGLWVIPGSHKKGVIWPHEPTEDPRYDQGSEARGHGHKEGDWKAVQLPTGSGIIFNGYLLHRSLPNTTAGFRRSFANHYSSAETAIPWSNDGRFKIRGEGDLRDFVLVSGTDPLEGMKPKVDLLTPFIRDENHKKRVREMTKE